MSLIDLIDKKYRIISIVGMAKNAGKTVTLNHIIQEAMYRDITLGITSTGRDGESQDVVTNTEKPTIYVMEGTLIATTSEFLGMGDAKVEIIEVTDFSTPLGNIVIGRVKEEGYVQIAGPQTSSEIKQVSERMLEFGANIIIVDGSLNRVSSAAPSITEGTILATGATVSRNVNKVIEETMHKTNLFRLDEVKDSEVRLEIQKCITNKKTCLIKDNMDVEQLDIRTAINCGDIIASHIDEDTRYIVIPGSLVKKTVEDIIMYTRKYKDVKFVVEDGTKIFIDAKSWLRFSKQGFNVEVLNGIDVIAITINPYAPQGYYFNPKEFLDKMETYLKDVPVMDVML